MNSAPTTTCRKVLLDLEPWQLLALTPLTHWCYGCKSMQRQNHDEVQNQFSCKRCGHVLLVQQLVIEGLLSESKYRGIEGA